MASYATHFIPENVVPGGSIQVYSGSLPVGRIKAESREMPGLGNKLYSFSALADVHVTYSAAAGAKFQRALAYLLNEARADFVAIAGDLTAAGNPEEFQTYAEYVRGLPVHDATGNHDVEQTSAGIDFLRPYTGRDLWYSFEHGGDLYIIFGMTGWPGKTGVLFSAESLQWLYEVLEENRNRRVFVFEHCPRFDGSGKVTDWPNPTGDLLSSDTGGVFMALMEHYKNVVWFHGHTHMEFKHQADCAHVNYDHMYGCHSVHIPSLATGRELNEAGTGYINTDAESEGYIVDVYAQHIVLRGRDFANEKFVPIATYCLDTTPTEISVGTFADSTGTIQT